MKDYRPLLLQTLNIQLPGLRLRRLRLNRHLPEADALGNHRHSFAQTLCYLSGRGLLRVGQQSIEVFPGALAILPKGETHGFRETIGRRPLTLVIDFDFSGFPGTRKGTKFCQLNDSETARIRHHLSEISHVKNPALPESRLLAASAALAILDIQLRALGLLPGRSRAVPGFVKKFQALVLDPKNDEMSISELAAQTGYQPDYLNRRFKQVTGLTLRQQRNVLRLEKAKKLLTQHRPIGEVAMGSGFDDANYFTRWFKRQTGLPPRLWAGK